MVLRGVAVAADIWIKRPGVVFCKRSDGTGAVDTELQLARSLNEVVPTPDSTRFLLRLTSPGSRDIVQGQRGRDTATSSTERAAELVEITNWVAEVQAKLEGKTPCASRRLPRLGHIVSAVVNFAHDHRTVARSRVD